jgi:uncharacterized membrane protein
MKSLATMAAHALESRHWRWWALVPLMIAGAALVDPLLWQHGFVFAALLLQQAFSFVCHQRPERSFWISGAPVMVCARCLGIYLGAAAGLMLRSSRSAATSLLITAATINAIDAGTELLGLHGNWLLVRFALGIGLGTAGGLLISSAMEAPLITDGNETWIA